MHQLHDWCTKLRHLGPSFGYFANPGKTWLIVKDDHLSTATELFAGTGVNITTEGKRHLGAALGPRSFVTTYVQAKVNKWVATIHELTKIAKTQPHAAYSAFIHGLAGKWTYFLRTICDITHLLQPLEDTIRHKFIPALTGRNGVSDAERDLFSLPVHLGGLGLTNPVEVCSHEFTSSVKVTAPLAALILLQQPGLSPDTMHNQQCAKATVRKTRRLLQSNTSAQLKAKLPHNLQRAMELGNEKGASSWLLPCLLRNMDFALHKGDFRDALCLRYNWQPTQLPCNCVCGKAFSINHALSCPTGGLPTIRHNELRDFTAKVMTEVCHDVCIKPHLQPSQARR